MSQKPSVSLLKALARMVDGDAVIEFNPYRHDLPDGSHIELPRDGCRIAIEGAGGPNVLTPATLSKAIRDGLVTSARREAVMHDGSMSLTGHCYSRPTPAGLALLDEWRWTLGSNENHGYAVLRASPYATRDVSPGPLLRITSRTAARVWFDPEYAHPLDRERGDHRKKGHGPKSYVEVRDVLGIVDTPEDYAALKMAHANRLTAVEETILAEEAEVAELAREVRDRWAAERSRLHAEGSSVVREAEKSVKPL